MIHQFIVYYNRKSSSLAIFLIMLIILNILFLSHMTTYHDYRYEIKLQLGWMIVIVIDCCFTSI